MRTFIVLTALLAGCATPAPRQLPTAPTIDYHQHLISPAFSAVIGSPEIDGRELVRRLDSAGVQRAVVLSVAYSMADERKKLSDPDRRTREENDWTSVQVAGSNGRLIGFCSANPLRDAALAELDRCLRLPGMRGIKLHFGNSGVSLRNPAHAARLATLFAFANRLRVPVLVHLRARGGQDYGAQDAQLFLDRLVTRAPDIDIIIAHFAGGGGYSTQYDELMAVFGAAAERHDPRLRHLYFDIATVIMPDTTAADAAKVALRIRQIGPRHVLYGSDLGVPQAPSISEWWRLFTTKVPLSIAEFATIANNRTRFVR